MSPERFATLIEAYGAEPSRWPAEERAAALGFIDQNPELAGPLLQTAAWLDDLFVLPETAPPSTFLRERIVASAGKAKTGWHRARLWLQGTGLAGVSLAGMLTGAILINMASPSHWRGDDEDDYVITAFDNINSEGDQ